MVFLSYAHDDASSALALARLLRSRGIDVWIDRSRVRAGMRWRKEIAEAIREADVVVLLLSEHSVRSRRVAQELAIADDLGRRIVPVRLDEVDIPPAVHFSLAGVQHVDFDTVDSEVFAEELAGLIAADALPAGGTGGPRTTVSAGRRPLLSVVPYVTVLSIAAALYVLFRFLTPHSASALSDAWPLPGAGHQPGLLTDVQSAATAQTTEPQGYARKLKEGDYELAYPSDWSIVDASRLELTVEHFRHPDEPLGYSVRIGDSGPDGGDGAFSDLVDEWRRRGLLFQEIDRQPAGPDVLVHGLLFGARTVWNADILIRPARSRVAVLYQLSGHDVPASRRNALFDQARGSFRPLESYRTHG